MAGTMDKFGFGSCHESSNVNQSAHQLTCRTSGCWYQVVRDHQPPDAEMAIDFSPSAGSN